MPSNVVHKVVIPPCVAAMAEKCDDQVQLFQIMLCCCPNITVMVSSLPKPIIMSVYEPSVHHHPRRGLDLLET